nr:hypothetical protein [Tanacetum cinerariifolium]
MIQPSNSVVLQSPIDTTSHANLKHQTPLVHQVSLHRGLTKLKGPLFLEDVTVVGASIESKWLLYSKATVSNAFLEEHGDNQQDDPRVP